MSVFNNSFGDLPKRLFSASLLLTLSLLCLYKGGWFSACFIGVCSGVLVWEILSITNQNHEHYKRGYFLSIFFILMFPLINLWTSYSTICILFSALASLVIKKNKVIRFLSIFYVGFSIFLFQKILLAEGEMNSFWIVIYIIAVVCSADIGGYFFGRVFGGPLLIKALSPRKTWSGVVGGWVLAIIIGSYLNFIFYGNLLFMIAISWALAISSQIGDLIESSFKRYFSVKDSGSILPGHGGLLDRLDGFLLAVPVYYLINLLI